MFQRSHRIFYYSRHMKIDVSIYSTSIIWKDHINNEITLSLRSAFNTQVSTILYKIITTLVIIYFYIRNRVVTKDCNPGISGIGIFHPGESRYSRDPDRIPITRNVKKIPIQSRYFRGSHVAEMFHMFIVGCFYRHGAFWGVERKRLPKTVERLILSRNFLNLNA